MNPIIRRTVAVAAVALIASAVNWPSSSSIAAAATKAKATKKPKAPKAIKSSLVWRACDDPLFQCTEFQAPADPANPAGPKITLSLVKRPLPAGVEKLGTVITGNGFPGFSGVASMKADVRVALYASSWARFDVIAFEHRGTGASSPVKCASTITELGYDAFTDTSGAKGAEIIEKWRADCISRNTLVSSHMSVADSVEDLEAIRVALGEPQLNFQMWGHDATIAAAYASKYPTKTRVSVLADPYPMSSRDDYLIDQAERDSKEVDRFLDNCQASTSCPLSSGAGARSRYLALTAKLVKAPVPVSADPKDGFIYPSDLQSLVRSAYGDESQWAPIAAAIAALETGDPKPYMALDLSFSPPLRFPFQTGGGPFWTIACTDRLYPTDRFRYYDLLDEIAPNSEWAYVDMAGMCEGWPAGAAAPAAYESAVPTLITTQRKVGVPDRWINSARSMLSQSAIMRYGLDDPGKACYQRTLTSFFESGKLPASPDTNC